MSSSSDSHTTFTSPYTHNVVGGSASNYIKKVLDDLVHIPSRRPPQKLFASTIMDSMILADVCIGSMAEEPARLEGKVVIQLVVNEGSSVYSERLSALVDISLYRYAQSSQHRSWWLYCVLCRFVCCIQARIWIYLAD